MPNIEEGMHKKEEYLELPEYPARYTFHQMNIYDEQFYRQIWKTCNRNIQSFNSIVVAVGSDLENIDIAQKLLLKKKEWSLENKIEIFVKIRNPENTNIIENQDIIPFGDEKTNSFDVKSIFDSRIEEMARQKHYLNELIKSRCDKEKILEKTDVEIKSMYEWYMYDSMRKLSSLYSIISLKMKLQLMGLDYQKKTENPEALQSNAAYFDIYARNDMPEIDSVVDVINGIQVYAYDRLINVDDLKHYTLRRNLAIQEHYRWNAFMISCGFIPATREQILSKNKGKDYELRHHGNLTTMEGLIEFRKMLTATNGKTELKNDVINYDYHLMDEAWWYLNAFGYEVIRR